MTTGERAVRACERLAGEVGPRSVFVSIAVSAVIADAIREAIAAERDALLARFRKLRDEHAAEAEQAGDFTGPRHAGMSVAYGNAIAIIEARERGNG